MTSPPLPPLPPLGPPRGTNFSRRKLTQPRPPSPAMTRILTSSMNFMRKTIQWRMPVSRAQLFFIMLPRVSISAFAHSCLPPDKKKAPKRGFRQATLAVIEPAERQRASAACPCAHSARSRRSKQREYNHAPFQHSCPDEYGFRAGALGYFLRARIHRRKPLRPGVALDCRGHYGNCHRPSYVP